MSELAKSIETYLDNCEKVRRLSPHTTAAYRSDLAQFSAAISCDPLEAIFIQAHLQRVAENPRYKVPTVRRKVAAIRGFLRSVDEKLASEVFASWKLKMRAPARLPKAVSRVDLGAILKSASAGQEFQSKKVNATTHLALSLLAATGLRISELCSLLTTDINPVTGEIKVYGKGARERVVIVSNARVLSALGQHIRHRTKIDGPIAPLLLNRRGRQLTPQSLRLRLHALVREVGLRRRVTPHMLRHTAATLLIEGGVDIRFVQRLLGHASVATTQIYTHVTDNALRAALKRADVMKGFA